MHSLQTANILLYTKLSNFPDMIETFKICPHNYK